MSLAALPLPSPSTTRGAPDASVVLTSGPPAASTSGESWRGRRFPSSFGSPVTGPFTAVTPGAAFAGSYAENEVVTVAVDGTQGGATPSQSGPLGTMCCATPVIALAWRTALATAGGGPPRTARPTPTHVPAMLTCRSVDAAAVAGRPTATPVEAAPPPSSIATSSAASAPEAEIPTASVASPRSIVPLLNTPPAKPVTAGAVPSIATSSARGAR